MKEACKVETSYFVRKNVEGLSTLFTNWATCLHAHFDEVHAERKKLMPSDGLPLFTVFLLFRSYNFACLFDRQQLVFAL